VAFADYYSRSALAASQILGGFEEPRIRAILDKVRVGIAIGADAATSAEGQAILDLLIRLLARLYPTLVFRWADSAAESAANRIMGLAQQINPNIDFAAEPSIEICIGKVLPVGGPWKRLFVGSSGWDALFSPSEPRSVGNSENPFGAGGAACFATANLFRLVFLGHDDSLDKELFFSTLNGGPCASENLPIAGSLEQIVLVGAGAIGNAAAWALARAPMEGTVHIVDHQLVDLGNLQRYVLAERRRENAIKVDVLAKHFVTRMQAKPHHEKFADFVEKQGYGWRKMLLALDSSGDRRAAQASLPKWVANAWTQPGDLGVASHDFLSGACVSCLYLPDRALENEDSIIASALNLSGNLMQVRTLLHTGIGVPKGFLEIVAAARAIPIERLLPFEGRPIRALYSEGFCGGAVIPLGEAGFPRQDVHVPVAHQSALSGVLLAAAAVKEALGLNKAVTSITRINVMAPIGELLTQPAAKDPRGICICQDADYVNVYREKYRL
jgi:hypothetical protein